MQGPKAGKSVDAIDNFRIIEIHSEKKPTVEFQDFVSPRDVYNAAGLGPSFAHFKMEPGQRLRHTHMNSFVETVLCTYVHHLPLTLSPDDVWTAIIQGFAIHMENHGEKLRKKFVNF